MKKYEFTVELYCEYDGSSMECIVPIEVKNPSAIIDTGSFGDDFIRAVFDRISIIPHSYEKV